MVSGVHIGARVGSEVGPVRAYRFFVRRDAVTPIKPCQGSHICEQAIFWAFGGPSKIPESTQLTYTFHILRNFAFIISL